MTITYQVKQAVYVNLTNRCPCACTFCLRNNASGVFGSGPLWLEREPTVEEVKASLATWDYSRYREVVFCGYGEPTERLDVLLAAAKYLRETQPGVRIRVNTNGLSDLIAGEPTAQRFAGLVDALSISLNTDDPAEYLAVCRPKFGAAAYPAMLAFAAAAKAYVPDVVMTVVDEPVTSRAKQERCRALCARLGVRLRVRPYEAPTTPQYILASGSPRRAKILKAQGFDFAIVKTDAPEVTYPHEPERTVRENAAAKLVAAQRYLVAHPHARPVAGLLAADTIVWCADKIYGKPRDLDEAKQFLRELSGRTHTVFTGVAYGRLVGEPHVEVARADVTFLPLDEATIAGYVARVNPLDRAGAYDVDVEGKRLIASYAGTYETIMGLPVEGLATWGGV